MAELGENSSVIVQADFVERLPSGSIVSRHEARFFGVKSPHLAKHYRIRTSAGNGL
jgi:hypothetical protein